MSLSSLQLDALVSVSRHLNFSLAAKELGLTQSALSRRVLNLEDELGVSLFIRDPAGIRLTEEGQKLLRYCHLKSGLEDEALSEIRGIHMREYKSLTGAVRIGGFSSIMTSIILPSLAPLLQKNSLLRFEFLSREIRQLRPLLSQGAIDYCLLYTSESGPSIETLFIGEEENILIAPLGSQQREPLYLDHDPEDSTTYDFFKSQGIVKSKLGTLRRSFLDDIFSILKAVELGLGYAVVPKHLLQKGHKIRIVEGTRSLKLKIWAHYFRQPFTTQLHKAIIAQLEKCRNYF